MCVIGGLGLPACVSHAAAVFFISLSLPLAPVTLYVDLICFKSLNVSLGFYVPCNTFKGMKTCEHLSENRLNYSKLLYTSLTLP